MIRSVRLVTAVSIFALAGACATPRTTAATQSSVPNFDVTKSDAKALAIADQVLAAVGGQANWDKAHEISWDQGIIVNGKLVALRSHMWDRWNGRHEFERPDAQGGKFIVMRDLFEDVSYGFVVTPEGQKGDAMKSDKKTMVEEAKTAFAQDLYLLVLPFKLRDPGVHLAYSEERPEDGSPKGSPAKYDVIKITFDKGVGPAADTYYLVVDKTTHLPAIVERVQEGKPDDVRAGFGLSGWKESGGLKFATQRVTLGYTKPDAPLTPLEVPPAWKEMVAPFAALKVPNPGELVLIGDVEVKPDSDDRNYIPQVK